MSDYADNSADEVEEKQDKTPEQWAEYWSKEIKSAKKWFRRFHDKGQKVESEYLAQSDGDSDDTSAARYNIFWANVNVLLAAVYAKLPVPEVDRTHLDQNDDVARVASIILERIFKFELDNLDESPDEAYRMAIKDRFIAGLGGVWPRYTFEEVSTTIPAMLDEAGIEVAPAYEDITITDEAVPLDYVRWDDIIYSPSRVWEKIRWQGRRVFMNRKSARARFGKIIAEQLSYKSSSKTTNLDDPMRLNPEPVAEVYELWCKDHKAVYWYSQGCPVILDVKDDPLNLTGFFPMKKPLVATLVSSAFLPRPDYAIVQDQYQELNLIAARTKMLTEALRVTGLYDKNSDGIQAILTNGGNNRLVPIENWAMFAEKGGIKGAIDWFPLEMVVNTLEKLTQRKAALLQEIYEILGLSDIMRGMSVASETATAQNLKAQYGSARMQKMQEEVAHFVTGAARTRGEIICNHWSRETILQRSQIMQTPDSAYAEQAVALLKSRPGMAMRLTITSDTLSAPDWAQEKQQRIDFLQAIAQFIGMSMPLIEKQPGSSKFLIQIMQWAATGFKAGKQIEGVLDQALQALEVDATKPKEPPPPPPEIIKANIEKESAKEIEGMKLQAADERENQKLGHEQQLAQIKEEQQTQRDLAEMAHKERMAEIEAQRDIEIERIKQENENLRRSEELEVEMFGGSLVKKAETLIVSHQAKCEAKEAAEAEAKSGEEKETPDISAELKQLMEIIAAPKEIVKDAQGHPIGVRVKGSK